MAGSVKVNIPGIGTIEATNAATEDTLQQILAVMKKTETVKKQQDTKAADDLQKQQKSATENLKDWQKTLIDGSDKSKKVLKENHSATEDVTASLGKFSKVGGAMRIVGTELVGALGNLAQTAISLTTAYMTSYDEMARDPIGAALTTLQTEVDAVASTTKHAATALAAGAGFLLGGPIGAAIGVAVGELIGKVVDGAAEMEKIYNQKMADELRKATQSLSEYSKMGASFAGGMAEMRTIANNASLGIDDLSKAATKAAGDIGASGLTHAEAVRKMAEGMGKLATTTGKSGAKFRDELLALGYSYEEQGEVMASFMAQQRAAGRDLKNLAPEELARGTREYATNLKVISDITGQDAKKLAEKARAEAQRAALSGKLNADQKIAFQSANSVLSKFGPEVQNALTQFMTLNGTVTDPAIAANKELMSMIRDTAAGVTAGDKQIAVATGERMKAAQSAMQADQMARATSIAGVAGVTGQAAEFGKLYDNILGAQLGSADASKKAADAEANLAGAAGATEKGLADLTKATMDQKVAMEGMAGKELGAYANRSAEALDSLTKSTRRLQEAINYIHGNTTGKFFSGGGKVLESAASAGGSILDKIASWFSGTEGKAAGGWSSGDPAGFLEKLHGTELIIPTSGGMIDTTSKGFSELVSAVGGTTTNDMAMLTKKIDELIVALGSSAGQGAVGNTDSIASAFNSFSDMMAEHLHVSKEMAVHAKDNKDLVQKLLNVTM